MLTEERLVERIGNVVVQPRALDREEILAVAIVTVVGERGHALRSERGGDGVRQHAFSAAAPTGDGDEEGRHALSPVGTAWTRRQIVS